MADAKKAIPNILKFEGGFSNHPADTGGCTCKGVTIGVYRKYYGKTKTCEDLKKITDEQWFTIFKTGYWDKIQGDKIENQSIAALCVDIAYGSGPVTAIKKIQRCLGLKDDGIIGPLSIQRLNAPDRKATFEKIWKMREQWFYNIVKAKPSQKVFLKGWLRRLDSYTFAE